jgi:protein required for attachment to host cells
MRTRTPDPEVESLEWVVVANAARARCFVRDPENHAMKELCDFVHPASRLKGSALGNDRSGQVRKSAASTQFAPHAEPHAKEHEAFAHEIASYLEEAALAHRFPRVALFATSAFLGALRAQLGDNTRRLVTASVALDLTTCQGRDLEERVAQALERTEPVQ